ncbi:hypothetical protein HMF8227_01841 [Saliniradius amylolyticus]|uniref:Tetratricopeptide repeat protein n=1 Tax=Saliniradius amylolyticus TaxID=2183582 RepID=A0A2S2E3V2_9ALTE|nr:hypothetical protein [Saliniradius amylolyticus]AWL12314.1 hypothetical protein HMF8227_01841 [Saliniradius amylolyticus]
MKPLTLKTLLLTVGMMSTSTWAITDAYKLMIIDDGDLANFIESGHYQKALESKSGKVDSPNALFVSEVNRCVANIRLSRYEEAETLCSKALTFSNEMDVPAHTRKELTSFALSNRAMARLKLSKHTAAISDLYEASIMSPNSYVEANLQTAKNQMQLSD